MIYKVSYVIQGGNRPGAIRNETEIPQLGMRVKVGSQIFRVVEVYEMMPPRDGTQFIHVVVASEHDVAFS